MTVDDKKIIYSMHRVGKTHGDKKVLKDISLSYFYGAKIGVLGLNGSGKSTLLKMAGLTRSTLAKFLCQMVTRLATFHKNLSLILLKL